MGTEGKRQEIDARIKAWEGELERLRVVLARAPDSVHARYNSGFVELYWRKEIVKSRWEMIRGIYRPDPADVQRFEEALAAMEAAWTEAQPMFSDVFKAQTA